MKKSCALLSLAGALLLLGGCPSRTRGGAAFPPSQSYAQSSGWTPPVTVAPAYAVLSRGADAQALIPDPSLAALAEELARRVARDSQARTPSVRVIQAVSWLAGITDPLPVVLTVKGTAGHTDPEVERGMREIVQSEHVTHVGYGRAVVGNDEVVVVTATRRRLTLDAVPRSVAMGARVSLRGRLADGLRSPAMVLTHPDGHTDETPLGESAEFLGQFRAAARGTYQVEISADSEAGSTVVANFPVYVDTEAPDTPEETSSIAAEEPAAVEAALMRTINEARQRARLPSLAELAPLLAAARAHSQDMADNRYVAHNSPTRGSPGQRLRAAGLLSGLSLENVARGYGAREIHEGLMVSPGHRANILNPQVTHVGIGVVREPGPSGALLVTQDFIEVARTIDPAAAATDLLARVNRSRTAQGVAALQARPQLQLAAERAARCFFEAPVRTQEECLGLASTALRDDALLYRRVQLAAAFGPRYEDTAGMQALLDSTTTAAGVGVAQGDRAGAPPRSVFVVYVLAVPR